MEQEKKVLNAFIATELLTVELLDLNKVMTLQSNNKKNIKSPKILSFEEIGFQNTLWAKDRVQKIDTNNFKYRVYLGAHQMHLLIKAVRDIYEITTEIFDNNMNQTYIASIDVDNAGKYIENSLFIQQSYLFIKHFSKGKLSDEIDLFNNFKVLEDEMKIITKNLLLEGVTYSLIKDLETILLDKTNMRILNKFNKGFVERISIEDKNDLKFNSSYLEDLEIVLRSINNGHEGPICEYLKGIGNNLRKDVDKDFNVKNKCLSIKNIPLGRWPSNVKHRLTTMQQVAVNLLISPESQNKIRSVNGPPGTGKTTLLKDLFSQVIIQRAIQMCTLKKPQDGFILEGKREINGFSYNINKLNDKLKGYSIVVASSNNGAVENISKDLPKIEAVIRDGDEYELEYKKIAESLDYFREIGSLIVKDSVEEEDMDCESSWGLFSAPLGNGANIEKFFKQLFNKKIGGDIISKLNEEPLEWDLTVKEFNHYINKVEKRINVLSNLISLYQDNSFIEIDKIREYKSKHAIETTSFFVPSKEFMHKNNYESQQIDTLYIENELNHLRAICFLYALKVHKAFLQNNSKIIEKNLKLLRMKRNINLNTDADILSDLWESLHLMVPVVSTTFSSFKNMYRGLKDGTIGYLVIDEAGQAVPQAAVGGIWRAKQTIVVGDPIQIEPVMTIDSTIMKDIQKNYRLQVDYLSKISSVQRLADLANPYGTIKNDTEEWIGVPLWVHRRCQNPMFNIANDLAYNRRMVLPPDMKKPYEPEDYLEGSTWIDIKGKVVGKQYVEEQGEFILEYVKAFFEEEDRLKKENNKYKERNIYIISPFTEIVGQLKSKFYEERNKLLMQNYSMSMETWINESIGTVHTFQGKEAHTVLFVCGTDMNTEESRKWICQKPNLLNVATTRAKKRFVLIADIDLFKDEQYFNTFYHYLPQATGVIPPNCPNCKERMVVRIAKQGQTSGMAFYACKNYPDCKKTMKLDPSIKICKTISLDQFYLLPWIKANS